VSASCPRSAAKCDADAYRAGMLLDRWLSLSHASYISTTCNSFMAPSGPVGLVQRNKEGMLYMTCADFGHVLYR
jgi:hypothetical protein